MSVAMWLNQIGAVFTIGMGLLGLLYPSGAARFTGLNAGTRTAFAEFRATFGGLFVALGAVPLITGEPSAYLVSSLAWIASAVGRVGSIVLDKGYEPKNFSAVVFEAAFGALLIAGSPYLAQLA